jgi:hypothetical protein
MQFEALIEGLQIFAKYDKRGLAQYDKRGLEGHAGGADHDVFWGVAIDIECDYDAGPVLDEDGEETLIDISISEQDHNQLLELGWFIDTENECWTAFV